MPRFARLAETDLCENLEAKLDILEAQGVTVIDRRQTYLDEAVDVSRICRGAVLYPGTRLVGVQTFGFALIISFTFMLLILPRAHFYRH